MTERVNDVRRGDIANGIALHDFRESKLDYKKWCECVVSFFRAYGIEPTNISSPSKTNNKLITFKKGIKNHEKINYEVDHITITAVPPEHYIEMFDAIFFAFFDKRYSNAVVDSKIVKIDDKLFQDFVKDLVDIVKPKYGYIFQRNFQNVVGYEFGMNSGRLSDEERTLVGRWGKVYRNGGKYKTGDLRDIYPVNILSRTHMEREIFPNKTFKDWVESSGNHGRLQQLNNELWSWYVSDELISPVRESLRPTGMVLCI